MANFNATPLSDANSKASKAGVINGDDTSGIKPQASDSKSHAYCGSGRYNHRNGTINLDGVLGRSRFDRK